MRNKYIDLAINKLGIAFDSLDLTFHQMNTGVPGDVTSYWPGPDDEDILICVFKGNHIHEPFHRQDFFFINYAYKNSYQALSEKYNNLITINENECYIGQPYSGYALRADSNEDVVIIGVLIRKDSFFREYLPTVYTDSALFRFFVEPQSNKFSDEYIHLPVTKDHAIRTILELMVVEYADRQEDTQRILKSMLQTLLLEISRRYRIEKSGTAAKTDEDKFAKADIKWEDAAYVDAPLLTDCPVSIECSVVDSSMSGTHELFIGKVEAIHVDEEYLDANGNILWNKMDLM